MSIWWSPTQLGENIVPEENADSGGTNARTKQIRALEEQIRALEEQIRKLENGG